MTAEDETYEWNPRISWEEAKGILTARGVPTTCFQCGQEDWVPLVSAQMAGVALSGFDDSHKATQSYVPATAFICMNCSTVWTLVTQVLRGFADERVQKVRES